MVADKMTVEEAKKAVVEWRIETTRLEALLQAHRETLREIQLRCPHIEEYTPDASGNNGWSLDCTICDKDLRRRR